MHLPHFWSSIEKSPHYDYFNDVKLLITEIIRIIDVFTCTDLAMIC